MAGVPEERRVVTALIADVAGSTRITEEHGPEEARLIVGEPIARAVRVVETYGGRSRTSPATACSRSSAPRSPTRTTPNGRS